MYRTILPVIFCAVSGISCAQTPPKPAEVMVVGCDHLSQIYKADKPTTDVLTPQGQQQIGRFTNSLAKFRPDMLVVEALPEEQSRLDSLYALYRQDKLNFTTLSDGRREVFQVAFRLGKQLQLPKIYCVNAPGGTSQGILRTGQNIEVYQQAGAELGKVAGPTKAALENGSLSLYNYLATINQPAVYNLVYQLRYVAPARVRNSHFTNPDAAVDTAFVDPRYIGAELISVFKNRDYKIYSNIVTQALQSRPQRVLALFGAAHLGSLQHIFAVDPAFRVVESRKYLKK